MMRALQWRRWSVIAAVTLVAALMVVNLLVYPSLRRDSQFTLYVITVAIVGALYLALTLWWTSLSALEPALRWGTLSGWALASAG